MAKRSQQPIILYNMEDKPIQFPAPPQPKITDQAANAMEFDRSMKYHADQQAQQAERAPLTNAEKKAQSQRRKMSARAEAAAARLEEAARMKPIRDALTERLREAAERGRARQQ